jgi:hypothetical protein
MLLHNESTGRYTHHKQVKLVCYYIEKERKLTIANSKSSRLSYSVVVSLSLESILSKIYRYEANLSDSVVSLSGQNCENYDCCLIGHHEYI